MVAFPEYTYIAVLGVICGFIFAFGIGANDVANAFGSSISARSLTLGQAIILGSIMEIAGAVLLGASVTGTIRGKIIKTEYYDDAPEIFMFGSLSSLIVGMIWLLIATAKEFPVSTTHDIVAAYLGFTIVANGFESVDWKVTNLIFVSWIASPLFAGIISCLFFKLVLELVLKKENTFERATAVYPIVVFVAFTANIFFILSKSGKNKTTLEEPEWNQRVVLPASLGGGSIIALLTWVGLVPWLRAKINREFEEQGATAHGSLEAAPIDSTYKQVPEIPGSDEDGDQDGGQDGDQDSELTEYDSGKKGTSKVGAAKKVVVLETPKEEAPMPVHYSPNLFASAWNYFADNTFRQDLHEISMKESARAAHIWENSTEYDAKSERLFQYLQIFTACLASFAHGSNDVANAIAPVSGILEIYKHGEFVKKAEVSKGILAMGGVAIALGFTFFGYRIVKSVGFKLTHLTPAKGFCVELAAALAVSLASFMQIPVSTTQCLVGATCGVGVAAAGLKGVEWWYLLRTMCGWVGIFFVVALVNAGFFAFCVYSPSL